jgi:hypothetical protein
MWYSGNLKSAQFRKLLKIFKSSIKQILNNFFHWEGTRFEFTSLSWFWILEKYSNLAGPTCQHPCTFWLHVGCPPTMWAADLSPGWAHLPALWLWLPPFCRHPRFHHRPMWAADLSPRAWRAELLLSHFTSTWSISPLSHHFAARHLACLR